MGKPRNPLWVFDRLRGSAHDLHVRLRHRLILKPHGFESFSAVLILEDVDHLAAAHFDMEIDAKLDLNATSLTASSQQPGGENVIACIESLLDIEPVLIPRLQPAVPDPYGTLDSMGGRVVLLDWCPFDLRVRKVTERVEVVLEGPDVPTDDLYVLLRHRLLPFLGEALGGSTGLVGVVIDRDPRDHSLHPLRHEY
jgi:hypothetical protein